MADEKDFSNQIIEDTEGKADKDKESEKQEPENHNESVNQTIEDVEKDNRELKELAEDKELDHFLDDAHGEIDKDFEAADAIGREDVSEAHHMGIDEMKLENQKLSKETAELSNDIQEKINKAKQDIELLKLEKQKLELQKEIRMLKSPIARAKEHLMNVRDNIRESATKIMENAKEFGRSVAHIPKNAYEKSAAFINRQADKAKMNLHSIMENHYEKRAEIHKAHMNDYLRMEAQINRQIAEKNARIKSRELAKMHFINSIPFTKKKTEEQVLNNPKYLKKLKIDPSTKEMRDYVHEKAREHREKMRAAQSKQQTEEQKKSTIVERTQKAKEQELGINDIDKPKTKEKSKTMDVVTKGVDTIKKQAEKAAENIR